MTAGRAAVIGAVLAALQLAITGILALLALIVLSQGLPQDYDSAATMSFEANTVAAVTPRSALLLGPALIVSVVLIGRGRTSSRSLFVCSAVLLLASIVLGAIAFRVWAGMGW